MTVSRLPEKLAHRARHLRAWRFQIGVLVATLAFGVLAVLARTVLYFEIDLTLTRAIQGLRVPGLVALLDAVAWVGFPNQSNVIFGTVIVALFLLGLRLEAAMTFFAAAGSAGLWMLLVPFIDRPRPSPDLVNVTRQLTEASFPSGHALNLTAIFGFLLYLAYVRAPAGWWRTALMAMLSVPLLTVGVARVQAGAHWPSDVLGGYLLGTIWLALTIGLYRWGKQRLSARHADAAPDGEGDHVAEDVRATAT